LSIQNQNIRSFFGFKFLGVAGCFWPWPLGGGAAQCRGPPRRRWRLVRTGGCGRWIQTSTRRPRRGSTNRRHGQRRGKYSSKNISQTCGDHKPPRLPHPPHNKDAPRVAFPSFWLVRASGGRPWQAPCSCERSAPLARTSYVCKNSVPSVDVSVIFRRETVRGDGVGMTCGCARMCVLGGQVMSQLRAWLPHALMFIHEHTCTCTLKYVQYTRAHRRSQV
jgi:hypothetical protein